MINNPAHNFPMAPMTCVAPFIEARFGGHILIILKSEYVNKTMLFTFSFFRDT